MYGHTRRLRVSLASSALACVLVASAFAHADGASPAQASAAQMKEAKDHFTAGRKAIDSKDWETAAAELRASLDIVDSPNARLQLARALRQADKLAEAWAEYNRTIEDATRLGSGGDDRYSKAREAASAERGEIEPKLALVTVSIAHAPPGASLKVGGRTIASEKWNAPVVVTPGAVDIVLVDSSGQELARTTASAPLGEKTAVSLDAQPPAPASADTTQVAPQQMSSDDKPDFGEHAQASFEPSSAPPPSGPTRLRPYAYIAAGVGAAGLVTFAIFGVMNNATYGDLKNVCQPGCPADKQSEIDGGRTQQLVANIGLGVGLAGLAAGTVLWFMSRPPHTPAPGTAVVVAPGYLGLRGSL